MNDSRRPLSVVHGAATAGGRLEERGDEELMLLAAGEYRPGFEALVARYLPRLANYCAKFIGSARAGEDVAQEVLLDTWAHRHGYRPTASFQVFLFSLARNRCLNHVRDAARRARWNVGPVADERSAHRAADVAPDQLDVLLERERQRQVRGALLALTPKLREAILLRFDQGLGYAEISRVVGRSEGTVRSRVFHALRQLRAALPGGGEP